jgi:hypothetical protein
VIKKILGESELPLFLPSKHWVAKESVYKSLPSSIQIHYQSPRSILLRWSDCGHFFESRCGILTVHGQVIVLEDGILALSGGEVLPLWGEGLPKNIDTYSVGARRFWRQGDVSGAISISHESGRLFWAAYSCSTLEKLFFIQKS